MDTALVVLAAGIGSRYGQGIKQLERVGTSGELIIDYSIYDAIQAGFNKVIFIIRKDIEKDFKEIIGNRMSKIVKVEYAYQELDDIPDGCSVPEGRVKPWGTGHALLACRGMLHEPFCVINADDFYGKEGFRAVHDYMVNEMDQDAEKMDMCMAGFILKNTLSENGGVARGICTVDEAMKLTAVNETFDIRENVDGSMHAVDETGHPVTVTGEQFVSMNLWGFPPKFMDVLKKGFPEFIAERGTELKSEFLLPNIVNSCIQDGSGTVRLLPSHDKWFGVTYHEDKEYVVNSIKQLVADGVYPDNLYR